MSSALNFVITDSEADYEKTNVKSTGRHRRRDALRRSNAHSGVPLRLGLRHMIGEIFPSFLNFTQNMWSGNEPNCKGHDMVGGGQSQKWTFRYGNAETFEDRILCASFNLSPKVTISIVGDTLNILDFRYSGKFDEWSYCNKPAGRIHGTFMAVHQHELEPERIEKYLNTNIPNCKIWDMIQARAKELYNQSQV